MDGNEYAADDMYNRIGQEAAAIDSFRTVAKSIETYYLSIINYFNNRSTNASAEAFNAKIKAFSFCQRCSGY